MKKVLNIITGILLILPLLLFSQEVSLFQQFNGHYDYLAFGNTLNLEENGNDPGCDILSESSADFQLQAGQTIVAAYLYWAGSGEGDFEVSLNGNAIVSEREFSFLFIDDNDVYNYFAAFTEVTSLLNATGNGNYTFSDLDLFETIQPFCQLNGGNNTNFGGWAVIVIYEDASLLLNQVSIFDGLQAVSQTNNTLQIELNNLNILNNAGAKIGFLAWEGDANLANNETLSINGNVISNPPLNPANNAFNGTNSFTGSDQFYNMDIDFYSLENNINPGDTSAIISLTSSQDMVIINNIITVLNSELPDATIQIDSLIGGAECGSRAIELNYTVYNSNSTATLPIGTAIAIYANQTLVGQAFTLTEIAIEGSETGTIILNIPNAIPADFILKAVVDDVGDGSGLVVEINEDNNSFEIDFHLLVNPAFESPLDLELCNVLGIEYFDLMEATSTIDTSYSLSFHLTEEEAINYTNPIAETQAFLNSENPQIIFIRVANEDCFLTDSFSIEVIECPLPDATITINNDLYACRQRDFTIDYTVFNTEATGSLPAATLITFYIDDVFLIQTETQNIIPIGGSETNTLQVILPESTADNFALIAKVDDNENGNGWVEELDETNNDFVINVAFGSLSPIQSLPNLLACDEGFDTATFNLTQQNDLISENIEDVISYFTNQEDAIANQNEIVDPGNFQNETDPQIIYVRLENIICFTTTSFLIETENCAPDIPEGFSPSGDGINDEFEIYNLLNIYSNFELTIYSRFGNIVYKGKNEDGFWDGIANEGLLFTGSLVPTGVYYYVLNLRDPSFPEPFIGDVYVNY